MAVLEWIVFVVMRTVAVYQESLLLVGVCTAWVRCLHYRTCCSRGVWSGVCPGSHLISTYLTAQMQSINCCMHKHMCTTALHCVGCVPCVALVPPGGCCSSAPALKTGGGPSLLVCVCVCALVSPATCIIKSGLDVCWHPNVLSTNHGHVRIVRGMLV